MDFAPLVKPTLLRCTKIVKLVEYSVDTMNYDVVSIVCIYVFGKVDGGY